MTSKLVATGTVYGAHPEKLVEEFNGRSRDGYTLEVTLAPAIAKMVLVDIFHELPHPTGGGGGVVLANVIHSFFKDYEYHMESDGTHFDAVPTPPPLITTKLPAIELEGGGFYRKEALGIWASVPLCTVVSWSLPALSNEDLKSILPADIAVFYCFPMSGANPGKIFSPEITALFKVNAIHPASAPWRVMEALLTQAHAKLRVNLIGPDDQEARDEARMEGMRYNGPKKSTVLIGLAADEIAAWDTSMGTAESRVTALLQKAMSSAVVPPPRRTYLD
jgi:hypothetical protein